MHHQSVKVNYTRKINHFALFFIPVFLRSVFPHEQSFGRFITGCVIGTVSLFIYIKPIRDKISIIATMFLSFDRPEDRPNTEDQSRLDLAIAMVSFVAKLSPRKHAMADFIREYASSNAVSKSFCYKIKTTLQDLTLIKWDDYWNEYRLNMERYKRDRKALRGFKGQIKKWQG